MLLCAPTAPAEPLLRMLCGLLRCVLLRDVWRWAWLRAMHGSASRLRRCVSLHGLADPAHHPVRCPRVCRERPSLVGKSSTKQASQQKRKAQHAPHAQQRHKQPKQQHQQHGGGAGAGGGGGPKQARRQPPQQVASTAGGMYTLT